MKNNNKNFFILRIIILLILLIVIIICSFYTGQKFFVLKHTYFDTTKSNVNSNITRWYFNAIVLIQ